MAKETKSMCAIINSNLTDYKFAPYKINFSDDKSTGLENKNNQLQYTIQVWSDAGTDGIWGDYSTIYQLADGSVVGFGNYAFEGWGFHPCTDKYLGCSGFYRR